MLIKKGPDSGVEELFIETNEIASDIRIAM